MRQLLRLTTLGCVVMLAACGGPSGPVVPQATAVSPTTAARGETITVTGMRFGTTPGALTVGGVAATVSDWTDTAIEATVPDGTPNAWQDVAVTTAGGTSTVSGLFVGVEFDGTGAELQDFILEQDVGTAILLQAETYDLAAMAPEFFIDNVDLYGRGEDATTLVLPTGFLTIVFAEFGESATVADLKMEGHGLALVHGTIRDTPFAAAGDLPEIVLERFAFEMTAPGVFGQVIPIAPNVDITVRDAVLDLEQGDVSLFSNGDVTFDNVELTTDTFEIGSLTGGFDLLDSQLTGVTGVLVAETGLKVQGSTVETTNGPLQLLGAANAAINGSTQDVGGPVEVSGSTVRALDADFGDGTDAGALIMVTQYAPIRLVDNPLIRAHDSFSISVMQSYTGEGDVELTGNQEIRVGVFEAEDAVNFRQEILVITVPSGNLRDRIVMEGNTIAASGDMVLSYVGGAGDAALSGNAISVGDAGAANFVVSIPGRGTIVAEGNDISFTAIALLMANDLDGETLRLTGNTFTNSSPNFGILQLGGLGGACEVTDNEVQVDDPTAVNTSIVAVLCEGGDPSDPIDLTGNTFSATGAVGSILQLTLTDSEAVNAIGNSLVADGLVVFDLSGSTATITQNSGQAATGPIAITGSAASTAAFTGNHFELADPSSIGFVLQNTGSVTVSDNTFEVTGTPGPGATALGLVAASNAIAVTATGNKFTGFTNALYFGDVNGGALGIDATINDNVFDFVIDAAPKVAELENVKDAIDATNNVWGTNTDVTTVEGYVTLSGDTAVQGGSILLDPIKQP